MFRLLRISVLLLAVICSSIGAPPPAPRLVLAAAAPSTSEAAPAVEDNFFVYLPVITKNYCNADYFDDFSQNRGWPVGGNNVANFSFFDGEYRMQLNHNTLYMTTSPACLLENYTAEVDARIVSETQIVVGMVIGNEFPEGGLDDIYMFLIFPNSRSFVLDRRVNNSYTRVASGINISAIKTGSQVNRLKMTRIDANLTLFVNDVELGTLNDPSIPGLTAVAVAAVGSLSAEVDARFDNLSITRITESTSVLAESTTFLPTLNTAHLARFENIEQP